MRVIETYAIDGFRCEIREHRNGTYSVRLTVYARGPDTGHALTLPQRYDDAGGARRGLLGYLDRGDGLYHGLKVKR